MTRLLGEEQQDRGADVAAAGTPTVVAAAAATALGSEARSEARSERGAGRTAGPAALVAVVGADPRR